MKYLFMVVKGNIRHNKVAYIGITILMMVLSLSLVTVYSVSTNSKNRQSKEIKRAGYTDYWAAFVSDRQLEKENMDAQSIIADIEKCEFVKSVKSINTYICNVKKDDKVTNMVFVVNDNNGVINFNQYDGDNRLIKSIELGENEISLPVCMGQMLGVHIGDKISVMVSKDVEHEFTVASFFEDPFMGSSMMGIKTVLVGDEGFKLFEKFTKQKESEDFIDSTINIFIEKTDSSMSDSEFERLLNEKTKFSSFTFLSLSKKMSQYYTMMMVNMFEVILIAFIVLLLIASLIVIGNSINSSIEQDIVNIGIYKALGMTDKGIRLSHVVSYSLVSVIGLLCGIPVSIPLINSMSGTIRNLTGLYANAGFEVAMAVIMIVCIVLLVSVFVFFKTRKVVKVSPVSALNEGQKGSSFSTRFNLKISHRFLNVSLAYRQFSTKYLKFVSIVLISVLLTVFMVIMNFVYTWTEDEKQIISMFEYFDYDAYVVYSEDAKNKVEETIKKYSDYELFDVSGQYVLLDNVQLQCTMISDTERITSLIKGELCKNDNEILITPFVAEDFGLKIGDKVTITILGWSEEMVVSGIYDSSNDVGKNICMSTDARAKFKVGPYAEDYEDDSEDKFYGGYVVFDDNTKAHEIKDALIKEFGEKLDMNTGLVVFDLYDDLMVGEDSSSGQIITGLRGVTMIVYVLAAVFILIAISLSAWKIMNIERKDYGIYKAIGITASNLRKQMALKFMFSCMIGSVIGTVIGMFVAQPVLKSAFAQFGMNRFFIEVTVGHVILPIVFMTAISFLCAYFCSRRIKKVEPRILIVE